MGSLKRITVAAVLLVFFSLLVSGAPPTRPPGITPGAEFVPGEVLIRFNAEAHDLDIAAIREALGATKLNRFRSGGHHWRLGAGMTVEQAVARFSDHPKVKFIEPNYIIEADLVPNDPRLDELWGMINTGQTGGTPDADIDADTAWNVSTGSSSILVGVIDTGIDYNHPDLAANVWTNPGEIAGNGIDDDGNGYVDDVHGYDFYNNDGDPFDDNGHGTHCSGTIGAVGNNGIGVVGVNWNVKIMGIKFLGAGGSGSTANAVLSVDYATMMGVRLTSNSWGGGGYSQELYDAIARANAANIAFVAAAGNGYGQNTDVTPHYPSAYDLPNVISVAATNHNDQLASFSNIGPTTVDLGAPGQDVLSTLPGNSYGLLSGTSMATPHTSGVCALILAVNPNIPIAQMKQVLLDATDPIPALAGKCVSEGRLNAFFAIAEPDIVPPGAIGDLVTTEATSNTMFLGWTATGDDGIVGTASYYELRYSLAPIDDTNWSAAIRAGNEPAPGPYGTAESMEVRNLDADTLYYFAVKAFDEWGNPGPISNVASAYTLSPPTGSVDPLSIFDELFTGEQSDHTVTLTNTGVGTLDYTIPAPVLSEPYAVPAEPLVLGKDDIDPRYGDPVTDSQGGPDAFGYRWIDSDEPGGPAYDWTDISTTGTQLALTGDDQTSSPITLSFSFPFYGTLFDEIRVCTNGWLSFTSSATSYSNQPLPSAGGPENMVAPFWDDLHPRTNGRIYFQDFGNRAVVQWTDVERYSGAGSYTFQAILDAGGAITYQYYSLTGQVDSSTVGIQDASRTVGLPVSFNQAYLHEGLAVRINSIPLWLSAAPTSGRLYGGQSEVINLHMDASGLEGGNYPALVNILTNDPLNPTLGVDVTLHVIGAPDAEVQPASLDFGDAFLALPQQLELLVVNNGTDSLIVSDIVPSDPELDPQPRSFSVAPHSSESVIVTWTPSLLGPFNGSLAVESNDAGEPTITVPCAGNAIPAPVMVYTPTSFAETLYTGNSVTRTLHVTNTGGSPLEVRAAADLGGGTLVYAPGEGTTGAGGPDAFGYSWKDSDEPGGPNFAWVDISATGTPVSFSSPDDSVSAVIDMGMTFPHYGNNFSSLRVSTNGWLTFDTSYTFSSAFNSSIPSNSGPEDMIALFWDDLHLRGGDVRYLFDGTKFIIQFTHVGQYFPSSGEDYTFQAILYPSGKIVLQYLAMIGTDLESATIGIEDGTGSIGLEVAYNQTYVHDDLAIQLSRTPDWLAVTPSGLQVIPDGGSFDFSVTFDSSDQNAGVLQGAVVLTTNIPGEEEVRVPAQLTVIGAPIIGLIPESYDYGTQFTGYSYLTQFQIVNNGTDVLTVSDILTTDPTLTVLEPVADGELVIPEAEFQLPPGAARLFDLQWYPTTPAALVAAVRVLSDDPVTPNAVLPVRGVAIPPPVVGWSPTSFTEDLLVGDVVQRTLTLTNTGGSDLDYSLEAYLDSGVTVAVDSSPELKKGEDDTRPGVLGSGGPDVFGYTWRDSDEPGGPTFDWVDITTIGTPIPLTGDDQNRGPYPIGFDFPFYGNNFDTVRVSSNGFLTFTSTLTSYTNYLLPSSSAPENLLAMFHDDLTFTSSGDAYYYSDGNRFIVSFIAAPRLGSGGPYTFQAILYRNGRIVYQYLDMQGTRLDEATIGIQNATKDDGLTVVYNDDYVHDGLAVEIRPPTYWLSVSPEFGTVPPGGSVDLAVLFDTTELIGGDYTASIDVTTNDPAQAFFSVPVSMHLTGIPDIDAVPASLSFPMTFVGFSRDDSLVIQNVGTDVLHITGVEVTGNFSQVGLTPPVDLPVGGTIPVTVTFTPLSAGNLYGELRVTSDDPDEAPFVIPLDGFALIPPAIDVDPPAISTALPPGGSRTKTETICNNGGSDLYWDVGTNIISAYGTVTAGDYLELGKEDVDPRPGILGSGGPDMYGYSWKDSDEPGGPVYDWVDISGVGTQIWSGFYDDRNSGPVPIGFPFEFYGNTFTDVSVVTNGWLSFTSTRTTYTNQPLPNSGTAVPENLLAVFWDDLVHRSGTGSEPEPSAVYYYNDGTRFIVQFDRMYRFANYTDDLNFQVILYPSGKIVFQYETMAVSTTNSHTIGIQNATKDDGLTVVYNDGSYIHDNMAIEFSRFPEWVTVEPTSGTVPAGACQDVTVTLDAADLEDGIHEATIDFTSNDPYTPLVSVPITLNVSLVSPTWVDFAPDVLNLSSNGNFVTMTVQLTPDLDPYAIPVESVYLNDTVPALAAPPPEYGDRNLDGTTDVRFKFDREAVEAILPEGQTVQVYVQGEVFDVQWWRGFDTIRTMHPRITSPMGGEYYLSGTLVPITWDPPLGGNPNEYVVQITRDGGATWEELASGITGTSFDWTAAGELTGDAWIRVLALDNLGVMGYDWSDGPITVADSVLHPPFPVDGAEYFITKSGVDLVFEWKAPQTDPFHGPASQYRIMRAAGPEGPWTEVGLVSAVNYSEPLAATETWPVAYWKVIASNAAGDAE